MADGSHLLGQAMDYPTVHREYGERSGGRDNRTWHAVCSTDYPGQLPANVPALYRNILLKGGS